MLSPLLSKEMRRHIALPRGPIRSHKIPKMKFFGGIILKMKNMSKEIREDDEKRKDENCKLPS